MSDSKSLPFAFSANFNTRSESTGTELQAQSDRRFSIALMSDFSGAQNNAGSADLSGRRFVEIDRYNYDEILASMGLQLKLCLDADEDSGVDVSISSLKDFHPDQLYKNVAVFGQLRDLRQRLNNPQTFKQALEEISDFREDELLPVEEEPQQPQITETPAVDSSGGSILDSILEETENRSADNGKISNSAELVQESKSLVDGFIRKLVANKKGVISRDSRQDEMVAAVDEAITLQMRSLLHHPQFQALESSWRAVHFMVRRLRAGKSLKLYLLDVGREALAADLEIDDVTQSQLYKLFCDTSIGDVDWNLIIGDYRFGADIDDVLLLSQLGVIAQQAGAQFIAAADEKLVGCDAFAQSENPDKWLYEMPQPVEKAWSILRKSAVAKNISLALPRFILREPYGSKATPVKSFSFEEMPSSPEHESYLWGNPAFLKAEQIARSFLQTGWEMQYANVMNTEDLPLHYYQQAGRTLVKPCAEIPLTENGGAKMLAQGLIPLWSVKDADRIHSGDFHSIAE